MRVAILQSNYIPWKGYFDIIKSVDKFIFHDDLQYTKNDWRNRNLIKTPNGKKWLTIPCGTNEKRLICDVKLEDHTWQKKHWNQIVEFYKKAPFFHKYRTFFEEIYLAKDWVNLSELNQFVIKRISKQFLKIDDSRFDDSRSYDLKESKAARVVELLKKVNADEYVSGPSAKSYLTAQDCNRENIQLIWFEYSSYKEYPQFYPPFEHNVSIIDAIFHVGDSLNDYI